MAFSAATVRGSGSGSGGDGRSIRNTITQAGHTFGMRKVGNFAVNRVSAERVQRQVEAEQHADRARGYLRADRQAFGGGGLDSPKQQSPAFGRNICLGQ